MVWFEIEERLSQIRKDADAARDLIDEQMLDSVGPPILHDDTTAQEI